MIDPTYCPQCRAETNKFRRTCESCGCDKWLSDLTEATDSEVRESIESLEEGEA